MVRSKHGKQIEILAEREVFNQGIFRIVEARLNYEQHDGQMSAEVLRLKLDRGDSAAALVHHTTDDVLILACQFRYPTLHGGPAWLLELPAGVIEEDEEIEESLAREIREEVGFQTRKLDFIASFYVSPGGSTERVHLYYSAVDDGLELPGEGGGADHGEDIQVVRMPVDEALAATRRGEVLDAKTLIAFQWLALNRERL